jgi:cytochrome oxidase Cu insertion factor (SCO1/SenC/PrrC family)
MQNGSKPLHILAWTALGGILLLVVAVFALSPAVKHSGLPDYGAVNHFALTNQAEEVISLDDLRGKVWVADIIFTRCMGPCPKMTEQMRQLQSSFASQEPVRFVTLTTDPENDTPVTLRRYAQKFGADPGRWHFLTGSKSEILANLAVGSLKMSAVEKSENEREDPNDLFIHTTMFVLVDQTGRIRGFYESAEQGFQEKIQNDIRALLKEPR